MKLTKEQGEMAMKIIGDYPLYAAGLSNITYDEAIAVAKVFEPDTDKWAEYI